MTYGSGDSLSAAIFFGGVGAPGYTEEWNGTELVRGSDIPENSTSGAGGGESSESAIWVNYFGGRGNKWDGTSWSEISNMILCRYDAQGTETRDNFLE